jgi:hypothetical protein
MIEIIKENYSKKYKMHRNNNFNPEQFNILKMIY